MVSKSVLSFLEGIIFQFLTRYSEVFGTGALTPKHHFLIHYPRLIGMDGPLRHLWCMRFEAKHQYFKSIIASLGNYINVTNTMANRHQMRQCWEYTGNEVLTDNLIRRRIWWIQFSLHILIYSSTNLDIRLPIYQMYLHLCVARKSPGHRCVLKILWWNCEHF